MVLGYTGQINLAQAAFFGFGAYAVGLGTVAYGLNFWVSLRPRRRASPAAAGCVLGLTTLRLGGHYLAMITISFQQIFDLVMVNWVEFTRGPDGIAGIAAAVAVRLRAADDRAYLLLCAAGAVPADPVRLVAARARGSGRAMRAVRENELAAEVIGVHTLRTKVIAFTICARPGRLGGALYAAASPTSARTTSTSRARSSSSPMVLLGGAQSPFGAALGTVLIDPAAGVAALPASRIYLAVYGLGGDPDHGVHARRASGACCATAWERVRHAGRADRSAGVPPLDLDIAGRGPAPMLRAREPAEALRRPEGGGRHRPRGRAAARCTR